MLCDGRHLELAHARPDGGKGRFHGRVLHRGRAPDERELLGALDDLDGIDQLRGVHPSGLGELPTLEIIDQRNRQRPEAHQADRTARVRRERPFGELCVVDQRIGCAREAGRRHGGLHAAAQAVALGRQFGHRADGALADHAHALVPGKHDRHRVAERRGQVGKVLDVPAHVVVVVLHEQGIDLALLHGGAHCGPAPFELAGRDRRVDAFNLVGHARLLFCIRGATAVWSPYSNRRPWPLA